MHILIINRVFLFFNKFNAFGKYKIITGLKYHVIRVIVVGINVDVTETISAINVDVYNNFTSLFSLNFL